ncbi:MAG TPA: EF-hand domain-containing protein, partial [Patescibacteria group bacterium]|nr:EF-hand domain-containing protein [Patescibacteria group bacterium]
MINGLGSSSSATTAQLNQYFSKLDTNNNGQVSESEFVAGAPPGVSSGQATDLFNALASSSGSNSASSLST